MKKIAQITFPFSESGDSVLEKTFTDWQGAEKALASVKPPDLGYYKTDFCVEYEGGEKYSGRFDIGCDEPTLEAHIRGHILRVIDKVSIAEEVKKEYREFLENYQIG